MDAMTKLMTLFDEGKTDEMEALIKAPNWLNSILETRMELSVKVV